MAINLFFDKRLEGINVKIRWPQYLRNLEILIIIKDGLVQFYNKHFISDEKAISRRFEQKLGRNLNLDNPTKYNDKIQWLKLYWRDSLAPTCVDKYAVRDIIKEKIGDKYLNDLIEVYDSVDEIDLSQLPKSFVLKGTHGSGYNIICKNKNDMNWKNEFKKMRRWMRNNYYLRTREWVYKDIKPRIICEKYLEEKESGELKDYKIFCFNGEPQIIQVDIGRYTDHKRNYYDLNWNFLNIEIDGASDPKVKIPTPGNLEEMLELSRILSKEFPHVRVDFYIVEGKVIFGELTFFHGDGLYKFNPPEFEKEMGDWIELPNKTK